MSRRLLERLRIMGLVSALSGWLVIAAAISRNPWFVFTDNAFSDLGGPLANDPWVFNNGMILTGFMIVLFAFHLVYASMNKPSTVGGGFMVITGIFLTLIGFFPSGTQHHFFVSVWFFTQADLTLMAWGVGLMGLERWRNQGRLFLALSIVGPILLFLIPWPSIAAAEAYGIIIMNVWVALMTRITPSLTYAESN